MKRSTTLLTNWPRKLTILERVSKIVVIPLRKASIERYTDFDETDPLMDHAATMLRQRLDLRSIVIAHGRILAVSIIW